MRTFGSLLLFGFAAGLVGGCGIAGIPNFTKQDRSQEVPVDPIVTEGKADAQEEPVLEASDGEAMDSVSQQKTAFTCQGAAASQKSAISGLFNAFPSLILEKDALVEISTLEALVTISVNKPVGAACFNNSGAGNSITLNVNQTVQYLDIDGSTLALWQVNVAEGAAIKEIKVKPPATGALSLTISGPGEYPCPKVAGVKCN